MARTPSQVRYDERNREKIRARQAAYYQKCRDAAFAILGRLCVRCGFDDERALQIDHVNGGGRQEHKNGRTFVFRQVVAMNGDGYQTLCANCNWIKRAENNEL